MVFGLRSRKFSVPGLSAKPYSTISGWEMGTWRRPLNPEDWKLVQNCSSTRELRVTVRPMCSPGVIALRGISSPSHLTRPLFCVSCKWLSTWQGHHFPRCKSRVKILLLKMLSSSYGDLLHLTYITCPYSILNQGFDANLHISLWTFWLLLFFWLSTMRRSFVGDVVVTILHVPVSPPEIFYVKYFEYCGFCSNRILHYFPMLVSVCNSHRRDISSFLDNLIV